MATYPGGIPSLTRPTSGDPANDGSATDATVVVDAISDEVEAIAGELGVNPSGGSATVVARLDALDTTVSGKAATSHTHTAANVTDFAESVRDTIGSALVAGTNVTITVDDGADTITIAASGGGGGLSEEEVEDVVNGLLVAGSNVSLTYDDVANTLTVAVTGLGSAAALSTADIDERARDAVGSALVAGTGMTVTPNDGADTITVATSAVLPTVVDAKGDLLVGTAADTVGRLAVGPDGHVLTADSAEASGVKWAAAAGGSSTGVVLTGTGAPSGGSDGDWYIRQDVPTLLYRKESGSWVAVGTASAMLAANTAMRSSPWTLSSRGAAINPSTATVGQFFNNSTTNTTLSSGTVTVTNGTARARFAGAGAVMFGVSVTTLPGSGQTLKFAAGPILTTSGIPQIVVTNTGSARLEVYGNTIKTFSGTVNTGTTANTIFYITARAGFVVASQWNDPDALVDSAFYVGPAATGSTFDSYGPGWGMWGYGAAYVQAAEVYHV